MGYVGVVVDSSIWIDYFRSGSASEIEQLLNEGLVILAPIVAAELSTAQLTRSERRELDELLTNLRVHPTPLAHWISVGRLRGELALRGLHVSIPDAHVAQCALESNSHLWSRDQVFSRIAKHSKLALFQAS